MSNPSKLGALCYEPETTFGEDITTFATLRVPVLGSVDASGLVHSKIAPDRVVQRRQDGTQWILANQGGTFKTKLWLTGHGSATSGATTPSLTETLLGKVYGNVAASAAAGSTFTGGTATVPTTTASGTYSAGSLMRAGLQNDGRGNGQFYAIATHTALNMTLLTDMDAAPNNADVLYSAVNLYPSEDPINGVSITGLRFLLQTANLMYECHGVVCTGKTYGGLNTGEVPFVELTWTVAWWRYSTSTFPSAVATETFQPAANAGGSLFVNNVGTSTRTGKKRTFRAFTLNYKLGIEMLMGPGGPGQFQTFVGARRTIDEIKVMWTEDADAATTTPYLPGLGTATAAQHALYTLNPTAQKAVGFYFPNLCITNVALQKADKNINRLTVEAMAYTGPTTTNDLTACGMRMAFA